MDWIVFSYSLPTKANTPRVTLWRRLRRLGAVSPTGSVYILPANDDCVEAFQWLAQEIQAAEGEALVMQVTGFAGLEDGQIVALFNEARREEYDEILAAAADLEAQIAPGGAGEPAADLLSALQKLQKQQAEIARIDYFQCPQGVALSAELGRLRGLLLPEESAAAAVPAAAVKQYQGRRWVTRPRPHVDRLACAWLIRRYLDAAAVIRYAAAPRPGEVGFDMDGAEFSHRGNLCTFEVMLRAFGLDDPALRLLAEIVHEIDLRDGRYQRPETAGVDAALRGWLLAGVPDDDLEVQGLALFDGLYAALAGGLP